MSKKDKKMEDSQDFEFEHTKTNEIHEVVEDFECNGKFYKILIGKNDQNNWDIIDKSSPNDIWFHVDNQPSCHVIIQTDGELKVERGVIKHAAALCKENSKARHAHKVKIIFTLIKHVKKCTTVGSVTTKKTQHIVI